MYSIAYLNSNYKRCNRKDGESLGYAEVSFFNSLHLYLGGAAQPFLLRFFDVVLDHELAPECNLLAVKITQHLWVASNNLNALCF